MNGTISPDSVRQLAYQLWEERGCQGGSPEEDWFRAEEILSARQGAVVDGAGVEQSAKLGNAPTTPSSSSQPLKAGEKVDHAVDESFPASDPPAVHVKDEPPVNAGAKWKAAKAAKNPRRNASP